jgi:protein SCO1/2
MKNYNFLILIIIFLFTFSACQNKVQEPTSEGAKRYDLQGKVVAVDKEKRKITVKHEEIKGYMEAMTMDFPLVKESEWALNELAPGDGIGAELVVTNDGYWLEKIAISQAPRDEKGKPVSIETSNPQVGKEVPDFKLINQDGKNISFNQFRGKILALTFIYTRCPIPNYCPLMSINFSDLEKELRKSPELTEEVRLLSITMDPEYDTPEVLKKYGMGYFGKDTKPSFDIWQLAVAAPQETLAIGKFFGLSYLKDENNKDQIIHNLQTAVIDTDGKVFIIYPGNGWKPKDILQDIQNLSANQIK